MYGVIRLQKHKKADLYGIEKEANRTEKINLPNREIDWDRTKDNCFYRKAEGWSRLIESRLSELDLKVRRDAVYSCSVVITASHDFYEGKSKNEIEAYHQKCIKAVVDYWLQGDTSRIINCVAHYDEKTPHLHLEFMPLIKDEDGKHRLSAKDVMGNKGKLHNAQNFFYENVFKDYGFERGQCTMNMTEEEKHKHIDKQTYMLQQELKKLDVARDEIKAIDEIKARETYDPRQVERVKTGGVFNKKEVVQMSEEQFQSLKSSADIKEIEYVVNQKVAKLERAIEKITQPTEQLELELIQKQNEITALNNQILRLQNEKKELKRTIERLEEIIEQYVPERVKNAFRAISEHHRSR